MEVLTVFDAKDYQDTVGIYEKYSVRAIIVRDGKLAMQCSSEGEYKIPGGGQEAGETFEQTLVREVREETGLLVQEASIQELGEIREIRRDIFDCSKKYVCHSMFYFCRVAKEQVEIQLTPSEKARGYYLKWATPQEIYQRNILLEKDPWIIRDTAFVKMLADKKIQIPDKL